MECCFVLFYIQVCQAHLFLAQIQHQSMSLINPSAGAHSDTEPETLIATIQGPDIAVWFPRLDKGLLGKTKITQNMGWFQEENVNETYSVRG